MLLKQKFPVHRWVLWWRLPWEKHGSDDVSSSSLDSSFQGWHEATLPVEWMISTFLEKFYFGDEKFLPTQENQYGFLSYEICPLINKQLNDRTWTLCFLEVKHYFKAHSLVLKPHEAIEFKLRLMWFIFLMPWQASFIYKGGSWRFMREGDIELFCCGWCRLLYGRPNTTLHQNKLSSIKNKLKNKTSYFPKLPILFILAK